MLKIQTHSSKLLANALSVVSKCINKKSSIAILGSIMMRNKDGKFYFTASSGEAQLSIPAPISVIDGSLTSPVCLPIGLLTYIQALPDCVLTLTFGANNTLDLDYCITTSSENSKAGKASLAYRDASEFPLFAENGEPTSGITIRGDEFAYAIKHARVFSGKDDLRPQINSMLIDIADDSSANFVATDGSILMRIAYTEKGDPVMPTSIIVPSSFFAPLSAFADCADVKVEKSEKHLRFSSDDIELLCVGTEYRYPNYNSVIPRENLYYCIFQKAEMLDTIKRVAILGDTATQTIKIKVDKTNNLLEISAQDVDFSTGSTEQIALSECSCPDGFTIGFRSNYIADVLSAIRGDEVRMELSDPGRAGIFRATADDKVLALSMPIILSY